MSVQIKLYVNTGFVGARHEEIIDGPDDWETMTEDEREEWIDEAAKDYLINCIEFGGNVIK